MKKLVLIVVFSLILIGCKSNINKTEINESEVDLESKISVEEISFSDFLPLADMYRPLLMKNDFIYVVTSNYLIKENKLGPYYDTGLYQVNVETKKTIKLIEFEEGTKNLIVRAEFDNEGGVFIEKYAGIMDTMYDLASAEMTIYKIEGDNVTSLVNKGVNDTFHILRLVKLNENVFVEKVFMDNSSNLSNTKLELYNPQDLGNPIYVYSSNKNELIQGSVESEICSITIDSEILKCYVYSYNDSKIEFTEIPTNYFTSQIINSENRILTEYNVNNVASSLFSFKTNKITPLGSYLQNQSLGQSIFGATLVFDDKRVIVRDENHLKLWDIETLESTTLDNNELINLLDRSAKASYNVGYILVDNKFNFNGDKLLQGTYLTMNDNNPVLTTIDFKLSNIEEKGKYYVSLVSLYEGNKGLIQVNIEQYNFSTDQSTTELYQKFYFVK